MNGQRYDAVTGEPVQNAPARSTNHTTRSIDGFSKSATNYVDLAPPRIQPLPIQPIVHTPILDAVPRQPRKTAGNVSKTPQPSRALMRSAVHKPGKSTKRSITTSTHNDALLTVPTVAPKAMVHSVDERRASVASSTPKSTHIKKFTPVTAHPNPAQLAPAVHTPAAPIDGAPPVQPKRRGDIFSQALEQAVSHEQAYKAPRKSYRTATAVVVMALLVGVGFAGVNGVKAAKVELASSKAGFSISQPTYTPAGFSLGEMASEAGSASLVFVSNSDHDRSYSITEKSSQWDSNSLKNSLQETGKTYQTVESGGRTVFIDSDFNASWVNGGVWYQIQNDNALNNRQIINIVKSL